MSLRPCPAGSTPWHYPDRPLRPTEKFDCLTGRFLTGDDRSSGTIRYVTQADTSCALCDRFIPGGSEVEEDFITVCSTCAADLPA